MQGRLPGLAWRSRSDDKPRKASVMSPVEVAGLAGAAGHDLRPATPDLDCCATGPTPDRRSRP